jgi:hypothetical protein
LLLDLVLLELRFAALELRFLVAGAIQVTPFAG